MVFMVLRFTTYHFNRAYFAQGRVKMGRVVLIAVVFVERPQQVGFAFIAV